MNTICFTISQSIVITIIIYRDAYKTKQAHVLCGFVVAIIINAMCQQKQ